MPGVRVDDEVSDICSHGAETFHADAIEQGCYLIARGRIIAPTSTLADQRGAKIVQLR